MKKISVVTLVVMFILQGTNMWGQVPGLPAVGGVNVTPPVTNATFNGQKYTNPIFTLVKGAGNEGHWMKAHFVITPIVLFSNGSPTNQQGIPYIPNVTFQLLIGLLDQKQNVTYFYESHVTVGQLIGSKNVAQPTYNLYFFLSAAEIKAHDFINQIVKNPNLTFNYALLIYVNVNGVQVRQTAAEYNRFLSSYLNANFTNQFIQTALISFPGSGGSNVNLIPSILLTPANYSLFGITNSPIFNPL